MALGRNSRFPGAVPVTPAPLRAGGEASLLRQSCWWVGGPGWWLWDFTNHQTTAYVIVNNRARAPVTATLGADFAGVLVSDCLVIYDDVNPLRQKCYSNKTPKGAQAFVILASLAATARQRGRSFVTDLTKGQPSG